MTDLVVMAVAYLCLAAVMIGLLLFGESPMFRGTPVSWCHWALTEGIWSGLEWLLIKICGQRVQSWIERTLEFCCDRPNHFLQVSYVLLVGVCYYMYWTNLFSLLPNAWVSDIHIVTGTLSVGLCALSFVVACRSNPGFITEETVAVHCQLYPLDAIIWHEKECVTCHWERPARSKHCRVCGHCVARHDHHCGWINNCVGLLNHRLFLLFLVSNLIMTVYGGVLGVCILLGQAEQVGMLRHMVWDYRTGKVVALQQPWSRVLEWLVVVAPLPVALAFFMIAAALLVTLFLGYQLWLIAQGKTQYEVHRWRNLDMALRAQSQPQQLQQQQGTTADARIKSQRGGPGMEGPGTHSSTTAGARIKAAPGKKHGRQPEEAGGSAAAGPTARSSASTWCCGALAWFGGPSRVGVNRGHPAALRNVYDKGVLGNFSEVLFPYHHLLQCKKRR